MNKDETILKMQEKIKEINEYVNQKIENVDDETKAKILDIKNRTVDVIMSAAEKVEETANEVANDDSFKEFLLKVENKCTEAVQYTINKVNELLKNSDHEEKIKEATKQVQDAFESITNNDDIKDAISSIREVSQSIYKEFETYMAKPETQESIRKAKITTVRLAERGLSALKTFLKVEEEPKE